MAASLQELRKVQHFNQGVAVTWSYTFRENFTKDNVDEYPSVGHVVSFHCNSSNEITVKVKWNKEYHGSTDCILHPAHIMLLTDYLMK
jgi:hypothetical protein